MSQRILTPLEINHLRRFGYKDIDLNSVGEKPVEYITGHADFCGLDFLVTPSVLIPRLESEKIIDLAFDFISAISTPINIADIGSGSGCVGISLAKKLIEESILNFNLYFSDISEDALSVTKGNALRLLPNHQDKLHFIKSDLLTNYPQEIKFNLVIANLPYIPSTRIDSLDSSVKDYEPITALVGGTHGFEIINNLLRQLSPYLYPNSLTILEIDSEHQLSDFNIPSGLSAKIEKDLFDKNRFLVLQQKI